MNLIVRFTNAGWLYGTVTTVDQEDDVRQVKFDGSEEAAARVKTDELDRLCEEPIVGEVRFQFSKKFRGNAVLNGKIENISSKGKLVCRFDDDDVRTISRKPMEGLVEINFPQLKKVNDLNNLLNMSVSGSEEETLKQVGKQKSEKV